MSAWTGKQWIGVAVGIVFIALGVAAILIATHWPFTQSSVIHALEHSFASTVDVKSFRITYFPPGCVMDEVTFRRNSNHHVPPIASAQKLTIVGSYAGFFLFPKRIPRVKVEGLRVFVSASTERAGKEASAGAGADSSNVVIGEITADGTVLDFLSRDADSGDKGSSESSEAPLKFEIEKLTLNGAGNDRAMAFHVLLKNPTPPGEIQADGQFGPLKEDDVGQTAASGEYHFVHANLGVFPGIRGSLESTGKFGGILEKLQVDGNTDVPDFTVVHSGKPVHLKTQFAATVNGMDGDVTLKSVTLKFGKTSLVAHGEVAGKSGKTVSLTGTQPEGTIQDWLRLLAKAERPPMTGAMNFRTQVRVPPGRPDFIHRVELQGDFTIGSADFTKPNTQGKVNDLSHVALGEKPNEDSATVQDSMKGHVEMKNAIATFKDLYFGVPGALAQMHGTYGILTEKIDLHGTLRVDNKLSKGSSGFKAALLKVAEPFFKKKKHAEIVPIKMGGTFNQPTYGLDIAP